MNDLYPLLSPRSIAILGASSDFRKVNGRPLKHLLDKGYAGRIYPVNPKYSKLGVLDCYPSVAALPESVDLAIVAVPARSVAAVLRGAEPAVDAAAALMRYAETQAGRMLDDLKSKAILDGVRGKPAVDRAALTRLISAVSLFGAAAGERLQELDLNPVLAGRAGATAVDWLMVCS